MYKILKITKDGVRFEEKKNLGNLDRQGGLVWISTTARKEADLDELKKIFGFHQLAMEDCTDRQQRPKVDVFEDYLLVIVKQLELNGGVVVNHLGLLIGKDYLITISNKELPEIADVMNTLKTSGEKLIAPDILAHRILDHIVDFYFPVLDKIEDEIEVVEEEIMEKPNNKAIATDIFRTKRQLLSIRKAIWPIRDVFSMLSKGDLPQMSSESQIYYRDIYDHIVLVIDLVETYRDLVSSVLETYLSAISNAMNEVMKVLTVIATIFMPLTFIAGLYGMNFQNGGALNMPETYWDYGYPFVLILCLIVGLGMFIYFRRKKWV